MISDADAIVAALEGETSPAPRTSDSIAIVAAINGEDYGDLARLTSDARAIITAIEGDTYTGPTPTSDARAIIAAFREETYGGPTVTSRAAAIIAAVAGWSGGYDPLTVPGLVFWFDPGALSLNHDDVVPQLTDSSGPGNHATQAIVASRGLFKTNSIGGKPTVRLDGVNDFYEGAVTLATDTRSVFAVVRSNTAAGGTVMQFRKTGFGYICRLLRSGGVTFISGDVTTTNQTIAEDLSVTWQSPQVATWTQAAATRNTSFQLSGTSYTVSANPPNAETGAAGFFIGQIPTGQVWSGDFGDILVYDREVTAGESAYIKAGLGAKYGITIS